MILLFAGKDSHWHGGSRGVCVCVCVGKGCCDRVHKASFLKSVFNPNDSLRCKTLSSNPSLPLCDLGRCFLSASVSPSLKWVVEDSISYSSTVDQLNKLM